MNYTDFINYVAKESGSTKKDSRYYIESIFGALGDVLCKGEDVMITGFGKFKIVERPDRICKNFHTGEQMVSPAHKLCKFVPTASLKEAIK